MDAVLRIFRGDRPQGEFRDYSVPLHEGMVVLDAIHRGAEREQTPKMDAPEDARCVSIFVSLSMFVMLSTLSRLDLHTS